MKVILKRYLIILTILTITTTTIAPEAPPIDKFARGARYLELKRERELNEFNKILKEEHPDLFVLAMRESALIHKGDSVPNYKVYNKLGYIGAWQIHWSYLESMGIYGVTFENFIEDPDGVFPFEVQLYAIQFMIHKNIEYLGWYYEYYPGRRVRGVNITEEGMVFAAHLGGAWGLKKFLKNGNNPHDINGTTIKDYLDYKNTFRYIIN